MNLNEENNHKSEENNPFLVPGNYFDSFSKKMMHQIELAEELKEFKLLSSIYKKLPFTTPESYFEIKSELSAYPHLGLLKKENSFVVPNNYFATASLNVKNKIELIEELKSYPAINSIDKSNPFIVPDVYFNSFADSTMESLQGQSVNVAYGRVISLVFNKKTAYTIAAMLVISLGLYFFNSKTVAADTGCNTLACLDKNEIIKANQINTLDDEALMEIVNSDELQKNLNKNLNSEEVKQKEQQQTSQDYVLENVDVNDLTDEL